jgi:hypothetical protein
VLASIFRKFRDLFNVDQYRVAEAVYSAVVIEWHSAAGKLSYDKEKTYRNQECTTPTLQDVVDLFNRFDNLPEEDLQTLDVQSAVSVQARLLRPSGGSLRTTELPPDGQHLVIKPKISNCLFCKDAPLLMRLRTESCGGKAPGGHSWAYEFKSGARVAMMYEGMCEKCKSVYSLQTYTPGAAIMDKSGSTQSTPVQFFAFL